MSSRPECLYTKDHEWVRVEENIAVVGISDYAQLELGDVVYVDLPSVGTKVEKGNSMFTVESVKAVSDIYAPVDGEIVEINSELADSPQHVNEDPFSSGWMVKIKSDSLNLEDLMSLAEYNKHVEDVSK